MNTAPGAEVIMNVAGRPGLSVRRIFRPVVPGKSGFGDVSGPGGNIHKSEMATSAKMNCRCYLMQINNFGPGSADGQALRGGLRYVKLSIRVILY